MDVQRGWPRLKWRWRDGVATVERRKGNVASREVHLTGFGDRVGGGRGEAGMAPSFPAQASEAGWGRGGAGQPLPPHEEHWRSSSEGGPERNVQKGPGGRIGGLTFHGDLPAACQVRLVAHQDDGHVVRLMCAPQLNTELGGALEAASVCDGVHDDVGAARLHARLLAPAPVLCGGTPGPSSEDTQALAEKGAGVVSDGADVCTWDRFGGQMLPSFPVLCSKQ